MRVSGIFLGPQASAWPQLGSCQSPIGGLGSIDRQVKALERLRARSFHAWRGGLDLLRVGGRLGFERRTIAARLQDRDPQATKRVDQLGEADPPKSVLPAVFDARNHRLMDSRSPRNVALGQAEPMASALDQIPDQVEASLLLGIPRSIVPGHTGTLAADADRRRNCQLAGDWPAIGERLAARAGGAVGGAEVSAGRGGRASGGRRASVRRASGRGNMPLTRINMVKSLGTPEIKHQRRRRRGESSHGEPGAAPPIDSVIASD